MGGAEHSPNHQLYAWTEDTEGGEKYTLHIKVGGGRETHNACLPIHPPACLPACTVPTHVPSCQDQPSSTP